jgi:uncharacterized protein
MIFDRCPWYVAGPLIGLVVVGLRATVNKPLGALGGYIDVAENAFVPRKLGFRAYVLLGIMLGGVVFALVSGTSSHGAGPTGGLIPSGGLGLGVLGAAGVVMGFGARTAGGCTSGHGMSGMALGSPASIASSATFFAVAVGLAHGLAFFFGGGR